LRDDFLGKRDQLLPRPRGSAWSASVAGGAISPAMGSQMSNDEPFPAVV
jgi:hypothetical protein